MPKSPKLGKITFSSLSLPEQLQMSNLIDSVNILGGHQGPIELSNHLSLAGHKISNVGAAEGPKDVVTSEVAEANYSAKALRPHLEGGGKAALRTFLTGLKGDATASGPGVAQTTVGSVTGVAFDQIEGNLDVAQLPTSGLTATIPLAKLTTLGANGSATFTHGLLTGFTPPT
jgi:hypothetical protein